MSTSSSADPDPVGALSGGGPAMLCSYTIVRLRRRRAGVALLRHLRRVRREVAGLGDPPLLSRTAWHWRTSTISFVNVWRSPKSILLFNALPSHVEAVRWVHGAGHHTWTGVFRLVGVGDLSVRPGAHYWLGALDEAVVPAAEPGC